MDKITRCEEHNTTFIAEEGSPFDRCLVCLFDENDELVRLNKELFEKVESLEYEVTLLVR